jgi:predicted Rossmann-fold nucleotide-binding protein
MGREFWAPLLDFLAGTFEARGTISPGDLSLLTVTDSLDELDAVLQGAIAANAADWARGPRRRRLLGER